MMSTSTFAISDKNTTMDFWLRLEKHLWKIISGVIISIAATAVTGAIVNLMSISANNSKTVITIRPVTTIMTTTLLMKTIIMTSTKSSQITKTSQESKFNFEIVNPI